MDSCSLLFMISDNSQWSVLLKNIFYLLLLASRFKAFRKYVYRYTTESQNGVVGTSNLRNGPKVSCQVEIEVPQTCRFIMQTTDCSLSEVSDMDPQGQPAFGEAPSSDAFRTAMEKNPLKFSVEDMTSVKLFPEPDEPVNILNIKRGIISALLVPILEEEQERLMSTVHGQCSTSYLLQIVDPFDVTLSRDLSKCDQFYGRVLPNSPLALLQKLHSPLSKLITSSQNCNYVFDVKGKHIATAMCTEKHIYLPFSNGDSGISSIVTQKLSLQNTKRINNRVFDVNPEQRKPLHFEDPDEKAPVQTKDAVLSTFQELAGLATTDQGQRRTSLFHKLVSSMRVLRNETLSQAVADMFDTSGWLTWQALFQCGTPECTSAILQVIRTIDGVSLEVDALVYGLGLQADPDEARVRDMLSMAQYKQSKAIMYALANIVEKFHKSEVSPVVTDVSKFMETLLDDCSGENRDTDAEYYVDPEETYFLVLKVVGVMGHAMQDVSPSLLSSISQCAKKNDMSLLTQKAAIQAFRRMDMNDEIREVLMEVYQDTQNPAEKRIAAYLVLMKNPDIALVRDLTIVFENEQDEQLKSFVLSHLNNIRTSIDAGLKLWHQLNNLLFHNDRMSGNYKLDSPLGSVQTNIIFDNDAFPKEMTLGGNLKVFDDDYDVFEVGMEGNGFKQTIDALFGERGFFRESISKIMNRVSPQKNRMKRQVPQNLLRDITNAFQKLMDDVRSSSSPEAIAYLRLLGKEIGYMKSAEMRKMLETFLMYQHVFMRVLPYKAFSALTSSTENEVFGHYIFMENAFSLPTASGFPLKYSLAGVFAPGAKGGLNPSLPKTELSFMPSVGLEFITEMGVHVPDYVDSGIEMHTNLFHESSLNAKIAINKNQVKLSIPAPTTSTQLFSISNELLSVSSGQTRKVPSVEDKVDSVECQPFISGLNLCTVMLYPNATSADQAPYYPLTGETKLGVEIRPTGEVSEYSATITEETLREGKKGRHKVETLKLTLKAEGDDSTEATVALKYNRNKHILSTDVLIPDYDVEAGIKLALTDSDSNGLKMRGVTIDVTNKNIPQMTVVGRTRLDKMRNAMLQLQMAIPSLNTDASITANLRKEDNMFMDIETVVQVPETSYQQKASLRYDDDKLELEMKSDFNSEIQKMIPNLENHHRQLQQLIDNILDQKVAKTDMKLRHIVTKGIEAGNIWLDKLTASFPYLANLKRSSSDLTLPALPEKLFLQSDSLLRYQFNKEKMAVSLPLPFGGKKSEELNIPNTLSVPVIDLPEIGLYIPANSYQLPTFTIPPSLDFTVPLLGLAEASSKINSNFYSWEGSIAGGNNTVDVPSYVAQYKAMAQSPLCLLSYKLEGTGMMSGRPDENLKYLLNNSLSHCLIDTSFSVLETIKVTDKLNARANYKFEASSPLGLQASVYYSAQSTSAPDSDELSGDGTVDGSFKIGSFYANTSYTNSYNVRPLGREGRGQSTFQFYSPIIQVDNMIQGVYANDELNIVSKTSAQKDILKHVAELKYKDAQLTLKCNAIAKALGKSLNNKVELGASSKMALVRIESQADDDANRVYSLITGLLDSNGLEVNSEGTIVFDAGRGLHKASVKVGKNGLTTSGTNSIQCSPVTFENIFNCAIDGNGASVSSTTKAMADEGRGEMKIEGKVTPTEAYFNGDLKGHMYDGTTTNNLNMALNRRGLTLTGNNRGTLNQMETENSHKLTVTLWTLNLRSKTNNVLGKDVSYKHDAVVDVKPFVMGVDMTNDLKLYDVSLNNEGHMKLEPIKVDLSGSLRAAYGDDHNMRHSYELTYDNMAGTAKSKTSGNLKDTQLSHNCEVQFAGLSSTTNCEARMNSEPFRFNGTIRTMALPFSLTLEAFVDSDGEIHLKGKHTGELRSAFVLEAKPAILVYAHQSQVSATHQLSSGESSTNLDYEFGGLLSPSDQRLKWNLKSKLNDHSYQQDISGYNNPEKVGLEFSGVLLTEISGKSTPEMQEYSMSGFLKYDKNSDCHMIEIPFIESFPAAFEQLKTTLVQALQSLQEYLLNLDVNQLIADFRVKLDQLPRQANDLMQAMDLENKVNQVKAKLDYMINEFGITMDDLELAVKNLIENLEYVLKDTFTKLRDFFLNLEAYINDGHFADKITSFFYNIGNHLQDLDDRYKIKEKFIKMLNVIDDIIRQIDLQKLGETSAAFLQNLDAKYGILKMMKNRVSDIKEAMENFDINESLQNIKNYLLSIDWVAYVEQLRNMIPSSEIANIMESMNDVLVNWIDEYEIPNKLTAVYSYLKDLVLKYNLDNMLKQFMDQAVVLVNDFKIAETVKSMTDTLKSFNYETLYNNIMQFLYGVTDQLKSIDFRKSIDDLNEWISSTLNAMETFNYNNFVDETNRKLAEFIQYVNDQIKAYEIVQKIEALRDFFREIQSSIFSYLEELKNTKVADALRKLKTVIDTTFYNDLKIKLQDMLEDARQRISDMDIRDEMYKYLQRASESYTNIIAYISKQFDHVMDKIRDTVQDSDVYNGLKRAVDGVLGRLRKAEIEVPSFTIPLTDLVVPAFALNLNKLQDITIPAKFSLPEFTILDTYTIPAFTIDFEEIKAKLIAIIEDIRDFEIQTPDPDDIFGDLKVLYLSDLPDLTLPEITLSEIKVPFINIPKLNLDEFKIVNLQIPEVKFPAIPSDICVPVFGKLHGQFNLSIPHYTLLTAGKIENSTTNLKNPQFTASLTSQAKSSLEPLEYTFEATAQLEAPRMKKLLFKETVKATHMAFSIDHDGSLSLTGPSAEASAKTTAKATTPVYTADLFNNMALTLSDGISATMDTAYDHNFIIPSIKTASQASMKQNLAATVEPGKITMTADTTADGKWTIQEYADEGKHKSNVEFEIDSSVAKLTFVEETDTGEIKMKKMLKAEAVSLSHITVDARCESEVPSVKMSVLVLNGEAHIGDLKVALTASHNAEFTKNLGGSMYNSLEFMAHPFEIVLDVKNKLNSKIFFPIKITHKLDIEHDYGLILNADKQFAFSLASTRFNQYKYRHNIKAENNDMDIFLHASANGEANLGFLTVPLSLPEITIPYLAITIPEVIDFSLWENTGLKNLLSTPQQSFDMNFKLEYSKNPDVHSFELHLEPFYNAFSDNVNMIQAQFEDWRDKVVALLEDSYNQAKSQYIKHKIETSSIPPRIFRVPGYKIPILNIEVSSFRAEMPAFNYFVPKAVSTPSFKIPALGFSVPSYTVVLPTLKFPVIHIPETLRDLQLPSFRLPAIQNNVVIPAMGNITFDYSFKSTVITLTAHGGLYNQSDIVARFGSLSTSVFDILNSKIDGTTSLTRKRGLKLATTVSLVHNNLETNHECAINLNKRSVDASVANTAKINLPFLNLEINEELTGSTKTKSSLSSKNKLKYMFNIPLIESVGKGNLDVNWELETLSSHVSLETFTQGKTDMTLMDSLNFAGDLENIAKFYINVNGLRSTMRTTLNSNIDKQERQKRSSNNNILLFNLNKNMALEASLRRIFGTLDYSSSNNMEFLSFDSNGKHTVNGELDFVPLTTLKTRLNIDASQASSLGNVGLIQNINLVVGSEKQSFSWSGKEQLASFIHACDFLMSNDESEARVDLSGSVEGHLAFLKSVKLPVYQKNLWDVLKFNQVTSMDDLQFLNFSSSVVYTKSMDGQEFAIPYRLFENGVTFSVPEVSIPIPSWLKSVPDSIRNIDMRLENPDVPERLTLPPPITVPAFDIPFTSLHVEAFTIDPKNFNVPKVITTEAFEILLPGLPTLSVPSYDIDTEYLQGKMSFLQFKIPQHEVTVGGYTFSLNQITNPIFNFELPTIMIPQQNIEIPEVTLSLPSSVFIPAFGALSATFKISSPIYNVSTSATVEKKDSDLVTSLNSVCTSTLIFLEYDLTALATTGYENGVLNLNGKCNLIHNDVNVDWQHALAQNLRSKRQTSQADSAESRHTLNIDVKSPTFVDGNFRFASRKDSITASVSSPSSGFLGFQFLKRSPSQLYGKLFSRHLSSPEKDIDVLTAKATLRNSDKLTFQTTWNWEFFHDVIEATKDKTPEMREAVLKFINKYHTYHFGFDLNRGSMKLKNTLSNVVERAYHEAPVSFDAVQDAVSNLGDQGKDLYRKASDSLMSMSAEDIQETVNSKVRQINRHIEMILMDLLDTVKQFLQDTTIPWREQRVSLYEIVGEARRSVSLATDRAMTNIRSVVSDINQRIKHTEFTIPGTDIVFKGVDVVEELQSFRNSAMKLINRFLIAVIDFVESITAGAFQVIEKHAGNVLAYLKDVNRKLSPQVDAVHDDVRQFAKQHTEDAKNLAAEYKDFIKLQIQDTYSHFTMERVNNGIRDLITDLQLFVYNTLGELGDLIRRVSQSTAPYVRVSNKKVDVEVPLPFFWKSFSDWPTHFRQ
uniref:Apolipoprotein Ba n=1 Tax=Salarias fasciatus TaxID=181472 RepID=A0A672I0G0_SALFA